MVVESDIWYSRWYSFRALIEHLLCASTALTVWEWTVSTCQPPSHTAHSQVEERNSIIRQAHDEMHPHQGGPRTGSVKHDPRFQPCLGYMGIFSFELIMEG